MNNIPEPKKLISLLEILGFEKSDTISYKSTYRKYCLKNKCNSLYVNGYLYVNSRNDNSFLINDFTQKSIKSINFNTEQEVIDFIKEEFKSELRKHQIKKLLK